MSRDFNKVIIMGRLARDPDVRYTPSKQKVARFTVCTGRQWKNKATGELQSHTDFVPVTAWSFTADLIERYVKKGTQVLVEGRISTRDYDDVKTGQHKWVTEVVADNIVLLGSPRRGDEAGGDYQQSFGGQQGYGHAPQSDGMSAPDMGSLRGESGFADDFPLDFSELGGPDAPAGGSGDVEIPF
ncbi:MAG: single-stranded DNA-binding protein [Cloacibacillus sp.]